MDDFEGFLAQREASPLEYDPLDSASSSGSGSGDHSSPGDANLPSNPNWPNFSIVQLGAKQQRWSDHTQPPVDPENSIALTADFWSTAPSTTAHSPATTLGPATTLDPKMDYHYDEPINQRDIKVEQPHFDPNSIAPDSVFYPALALSMPLDLAAVDAGISPHLTGGLPSPDIPVRPLPLESTEQPAVASSSRLHSREASVAPAGQYVKEEDDDDVGASSRRPSVIATNLVTKEPVVASMVIPRLVAPAPSTLSAQSGLQMLVLGIPTVGAKSRVETQIKISVVLVRPTSEHGIDGNDLISLDGGIEAQAGEAFERIGSWTHIKIPQILAMRKKKLPKKLMKSDPPASKTLFLQVAVVRGSGTKEEIFICNGCRQREHKRAQRKKEARIRPTNEETGLPDVESEADQRKRVVIFNSPEFVEFSAGEIVLPTRITCYCRHHKERKGFCVSFVFRNHLGAIVATGATPPIMITDDHKTSNTTRPLTDSADVKPKKKKVSRAPSPSLSEFIPAADRPKRNSRAKANRGMVDSDDEGSVVSNGPATTRASNGVTKKAKPYDSDARPRKRSIGVHKSPAFTMTPLPLSKANSPVLRPLSDSPLNSLPPLPTHFEIDSLAPGDCWTASGEWEAREDDSTMRDSQYSTGGSAAPSPAQSFGLTSPPFSPVNGGITVPHIVDSFSPYDPVPAHPLQQQQTYAYPSASAQVAYPQSPYDPSYIPSSSIFSNIAPPLAGSAWGFANPARPQAPAPRISRLIPGEGPVHGGIEVTVLGENFVRDLICVFGDSPAMTTHFWSSNTLICILPPSANPGPVVVGIKGLPLSVEEGNSLQLFTYKDDSDRSLLELALQVVGLKMTGRLEDAKNVARRIVGSTGNATAGPSSNRTMNPTDNASLASSMAAATSHVYNTSANSRPASIVSSRRSSLDASHSAPPRSGSIAGTPLSFEAMVIRFLTLLDLDPSEFPGSAPSFPHASAPISHANTQRHTLLHLAAVLGFHRLSAFLIARGIDLESPDRNGFTALHFAALYGRVAITRQLLDAGAASYARNRAGKTAHDIARDRDDVDVEELFLRSRTTPTMTPRRQLSSSTLSRPGTPISLYARSASEDEHGWNGSQEDDSAWDSSDEDEEDEDIERGLSRNASIVSLHHLLDVEAAAKANAAGLDSEDEDENVEEDAGVVMMRPTRGWLSRVNPTVIFPGTAKPKRSKEVVPSSAVWEKVPGLAVAGEAWEKLGLPLMPDVMVFPTIPTGFSPKSWMGGNPVEGVLEVAGVEGEGEKSKDWKSLYGPWWQGKARRISSPPPPMYSPTDALALPTPTPPVPSTSTIPSIDHVLATAPPLKAHVKAKIQRRVGYVPEEISDSVVQSYLHHEEKMKNLKHDKMLYLFWAPILFLVLAWALYSSFGLYVRPNLDSLVSSILPFSRINRL